MTQLVGRGACLSFYIHICSAYAYSEQVLHMDILDW